MRGVDEDKVTVWGVANGDTYAYLHNLEQQLKQQGAEIMSQRIATKNPQKIALLDQAMSANQAAKNDLAEAGAHYNAIAEQVRIYSYGQYNPPTLTIGVPTGTGMRGFRGMSGFGFLPAIPAVISNIAVLAIIAGSVYALSALLTRLPETFNAAANFLAQANRIPETIGSGAKDVVGAASGAVDVLGKAALYAGVGFAVYLGYQALKKRGKI